MMARHWLFRVSVAANLFVLVYLALYSSSSNYPPTSTTVETNPAATSSSSSSSSSFSNNNNDVQPQPAPQQFRGGGEGSGNSFVLKSSSSSSNDNKLESLDENGVPESMQPLQQPLQTIVVADDAAETDSNDNDNSINNPSANSVNNNNNNIVGTDDVVKNGGEENQSAAVNNNNNNNSNNNKEMLNDSNALVPDKVVPKVEKLFPCDDLSPRSYFGQRGPFWVLYNYVKATRKFACDESITYTTHADFTFLDNLVPLLERWQGPVSLTMYSPGTDYAETLSRIRYLRECTSPLVKELVSFHLFFDHKFIPKGVTKSPLTGAAPVNCSAEPKFGDNIVTFKKQKRLPYPVNVARNVAREMAPTHYVLASDIELYPNPNLITDFFDMLRRNDSELQRPKPKLFVLPIFEAEANVTALPYDKTELQSMLSKGTAIPFHKYVCENCHRIPQQDKWMSTPHTAGLRVFHIGKRLKPYHHWEPIYIGTKLDPMYDERLTWEGRSDKMTQGYVLCVMDYEFHILNNAFLIHRPGIKRLTKNPGKNTVVVKQNKVIQSTILPELRNLYGRRNGCVV